MRPSAALLAPLALLLLLAGCRGGADDGLVAEVGRAAGGAREPGPRLSVSATARCSDLPGAERPCPERRRRRREAAARVLAARAAAAVRERVDADALHAAGLIDLLWADSAGRSLDRSIQSLRSAARIAEHPAPVLADLSAALLVRAERADQPRDLFEAAEAAAAAVEADSGSVAGRFNLALALEEIGLVDASAQAWEGYLARDGRSRWAVRARGRLAALRRPPPALPPLERPEHAAAFVSASPQEALYGGFDRLLPEWGAAVLAGDSARAVERLALAEAVGAALVRRGGDASLADAVAAVRAAGDARGLAAAHVRYGEARRMYVEARYGHAAEAFGEARALLAESTPLNAWASLFHGASLALSDRVAAGRPIIARIAAETDPIHFPSLAARARWSQGALELRAAEYADALESFQYAGQLLDVTSERENLGCVRYLLAQTQLGMADIEGAFGSLQDAIVTLREFPTSVWLHNALALTGSTAAAEGMPKLALAAHGEDVRVTTSIAIPTYAAEALLHRAMIRSQVGDLLGAATDIEDGSAMAARIEDAAVREFVTADLGLARSIVLTHSDPASAVTVLDSTAAYFAGLPLVLRLVPTLAVRANARLLVDDLSGAQADLEWAAGLLNAASTRVERATLRAAMADAAAPTTNHLVTLLVARGRPDAALVALERSRVNREGTLTATPRRDLVSVTYALIGDTLFSWTQRSGTLRFTRTNVEVDRLLRTVARVRTALERADEAPNIERELEALYAWLIDPLNLAADDKELVVTTDGDLAGVPFSALRNAQSNRYLVEERPVRFSPTLAVAQSRWEGTTGSAPVLIADPAFDPAANPHLERLPGAVDEVRRLVNYYPGAVVLSGSEAEPDAVQRALTSASLVHYAGHAVFDDERPERSFLLLAGRGGRLSADEIARMDLRSARLVVLSACRTLPGREGRSGGFAGFASALLSAGAGGVLGSLWEVDDRRTRTLMTGFHVALARDSDPARALRNAQLVLLRSPDPVLRSPASWAGFQYAGH